MARINQAIFCIHLIFMLSRGEIFCKNVSFCENELINIKCGTSERISIKNVFFSKSVKFCQPVNDSISKCQSQTLIYDKVNISCNGFAKCSVDFHSGEINKSCFSDGQSINVDYECQMSQVNDDSCKLCGYGAICNKLNEKVECKCPIGAIGDPRFRCCRPLKCSCWGDSHCSTFDNLRYDFTQTCLYDFVSTQCYNSSLPSSLVAFDVKFEFGKRESLRPNQVSFIRNIFIQVYGMKFLLYISRSGMPSFTLNGIQMTNNYFDEQNAEFGLTVKWNGVHKAEIILCDYYSNFVCGLCGNADGVTRNDKSDRKNNLVAQTDQWEIEWKAIKNSDSKYVFDNCQMDLNQKNSKEILCENKLKYENACSVMKMYDAPWKECVQKLSKELIEALFNSCVIDLCSLEGDFNQQAYRCYAFEELTSKCYETTNSTFINWRSQANCEIECNLNQEFKWDSSLACPINCFYLNEEYDCGIIEKQEGCFCKSGFILDSMGNCVKPEGCGCRLPEKNGMLEIGRTFKTPNCLNEYLCVQPYGNVIVIGNFDGCGMNAECIGDINNEPTCVCSNGYLGDGHYCYMENNELNNSVQLEDVSFFQTFCENSIMWLQCPADQIISIDNAEYGRSNFVKCQSINMTLELCNPLNVLNVVADYCNGKRSCKMEVLAEKMGIICPNVDKYLQIKYRCVPRPPLPDPCLGNPCGFGAICRNENGFPECSCPTGTSGDAKVRCCKTLTCGCWGDPHCTTFDNAKFDFMGKCKYELVTTKCFSRILPEGMIPFSIHQKQETRNGRENVAYVAYVEINVFNQQFRLLKKSGNRHKYTINGIIRPNNYVDNINGVRIYVSGANLVFSTTFGLTVTWNGNHKVDVILCDTYAKHVCGLCGNGDGLVSNDFVDKTNSLVNSDGKFYNNSLFVWGSNWRVLDNSKDDPLNLRICNPNNDPGPEPRSPNCINEETFKSEKWCGLLKNKTELWSKCLQKLDPILVDSIYSGCVFDLCNNGDEFNFLMELKCDAYEKLADICLDYDSSIQWRLHTNCTKSCELNQIYGVRNECPKTCLDPLGEIDCGVTKLTEGCFCQDGFVLDSKDQCVPYDKCGCILPDGSSFLSVNEVTKLDKCDEQFYCEQNGFEALTDILQPCSMFAVCMSGIEGEPKCVCKNGYTGDGFFCSNKTEDGLTHERSVLTTSRTTRVNNSENLSTLDRFDFDVFYEEDESIIEIKNNKSILFKNDSDSDLKPCESTNFCYGFGDPHYTDLNGYKFMIDNSCPYVLATDFCGHNDILSYLILINHENRNKNNKSVFMKTVAVLLNQNIYQISKNLKVNGVVETIPYLSETVRINKTDVYIIMETNMFTIYFDGDQMLKFQSCEKTICGLCNLTPGFSFKSNPNLKQYKVLSYNQEC